MTAVPSSSSRSRLAGRKPLVGLACLIAILIGLVLVFVLQPFETRRPKVTRPLSTRISAENAQLGTDEWADLGNYDVGQLAAYPGRVSVNAGEAISVYVTSTARTITARLYRLGYYQGHGARLVAIYPAYSIRSQPACTRDSATGLVRCSWLPTFTINTDPHWVSGIFLLRLNSSNGYRAFTYFVVRNDGYASDIIVQEASMTNQAYNTFGGESLYQTDHKEGRTRAYKVSFDRPYYQFGGVGTLVCY